MRTSFTTRGNIKPGALNVVKEFMARTFLILQMFRLHCSLFLYFIDDAVLLPNFFIIIIHRIKWYQVTNNITFLLILTLIGVCKFLYTNCDLL